jgi:serine protease Do
MMRSFCGITILFFVACVPVWAQGSIDASRRTAIVNAIEKASPAVVTINVVDIQRQTVGDPLFNDFLGMFGHRLGPPMAREKRVESIGTGFLFDSQGHILTNYHVLENADVITSVTLPDGRVLEVDFVGADERTDLAVLRADGDNLPHVSLGTSEDLMIGEWVIAIGNPFGTMMTDPQPSVSVGVVSANRRRVNRTVGGGERLYQDLIQTDAAINPGNSGGPLVNAAGVVVGVNTMIFSSSGGYQGLGFAIPVDRVKRVAEEIVEFGRRRNPWMGFRAEAIEDLRPGFLARQGIRVAEGVLITEILTRSPAYVSGVRVGDVIVEVNGQAVDRPVDVDFLNWGMFVGDRVELKVDRFGEEKVFGFEIVEVEQ